MKTILYVGATLMIGASIYGFVDYRKTNHRNEFKEMYESKEGPKELKPSVTKEVAVPEPKEDITLVANKEEVVKEPAKTVETKTELTKKTVSKNPAVKKFKPSKKKKLNYKSFSRASMR